MPFTKTDYSGVYTPTQILTLQKAYNLTCEKLGRCPTGHHDKDQLAKMIIRLYEGGEHLPEDIANVIYRIESLRS